MPVYRFRMNRGKNMDGIGNRGIIARIRARTPQGYCTDEDIVVASASGSRFTDADGKTYLDFTSGIFTNSFGHCYPPFVAAEIRAVGLMDNVHGRRTEAECHFYEELAPLLPFPDYKLIPYNDGGYAVDRGLSDIINYFDKQRIPIAAFRGGFHGKTMGTKLTINETAHAALFDNFQVDYPHCYRCPWHKERQTCGLHCLGEVIAKLKERRAKAVIFEPVQGAAVVVPPREFMTGFADFCRENGIIMFADEVLTGGGRTGYFLASYGLWGICPDIVSLTKGLANGRPLSVLCEREYITENPYAVRPGERSSTFAAHPVNLAVASAVLEELKKGEIFVRVRRSGVMLREELERLAAMFPSVGDVRSAGLMGAVEFVKSRSGKEPDAALAREVFFRARQNGLEAILSGHILRLAPPLNVAAADLEEGMAILRRSIEQVTKKG